jgi:hypothetical protein
MKALVPLIATLLAVPVRGGDTWRAREHYLHGTKLYDLGRLSLPAIRLAPRSRSPGLRHGRLALRPYAASICGPGAAYEQQQRGRRVTLTRSSTTAHGDCFGAAAVIGDYDGDGFPTTSWARPTPQATAGRSTSSVAPAATTGSAIVAAVLAAR